MPTTYKTILAIGVLLLTLGLACDFSPTTPFEGFDEKGSRISGTLTGSGSSGSALRARPQTTFTGITVFVRQDPSIRTDVASNGTFVLSGLPSGTVTLVFERDGQTLDQLTFHDVMPNQEIRVVLELTDSGRVNLVEEDRDDADLGECARGAGFWCQNKNGQNPNLSADDYEDLLEEAAPALDSAMTAEEIDAAVCDTSDQLRRQLAALALNIAAGLVSPDTGLVDESFNVGGAIETAISLLNSTDRSERNAIKDVIEDINESRNTEGTCSAEPEEEEDDPDDDASDLPSACQGWVSGNRVTICHIPPGNPEARHTITIGIPAWPAHEGHGDTCGPCS